jgi:hypothetical protein
VKYKIAFFVFAVISAANRLSETHNFNAAIAILIGLCAIASAIWALGKDAD